MSEGVRRAGVAGGGPRRPQLDRALGGLRAGDTLVVWRLDRLGRSLRHLIDVVTALDERGVGFRSLRESIDTTTSGGRLVFHLFGALAQFEREIIRDRTQAGLASARTRDRVGGRPPKLTADQVRTARRLYEERELTVADIGSVLGVSRTSIYRARCTMTLLGCPAVGEGSGAAGPRRLRHRWSQCLWGPGRDPAGDGAGHPRRAGGG